MRCPICQNELPTEADLCTACGTPEQLDGKAPTIRSDIYSLGVVFYELFTGKRAFEAPSLGALIKLRRSEALPQKSDKKSSVPQRCTKSTVNTDYEFAPFVLLCGVEDF